MFATGGPFDGSRIYYSGGVPLAGGGQLPQELQKTTQLGYDLIKTYVRLDDRLQKQVIDFAHANGMPVTSHEIYPAVASGADGVEHIRGTSRRGYSPKVTALNRSYQDVDRSADRVEDDDHADHRHHRGRVPADAGARSVAP